MSSTEKKSLLVSINPVFADIDLINHFRDAYTNRLPIDEKVMTLAHEPFSHCVIDDFILDKNVDQFCSQLSNELSNIKMNQKNNDLYKFQQSDDLANVTLPAIQQIKQFVYVDFKDWLAQATDIRLSDKVDMTCSKYGYSDYLLCHDDDIHGTIEGRRIAFIYYLVPETWKASDGGALDLFVTDDENQPHQIVKSLLPKRNRLAFFEVTDKSYHQVAEVLNDKQGARLSINGWLHGPINPRPAPIFESLPATKPASKFQQNDLERINQTISSMYLKVETQYDVQMAFQENSETKLSEFFRKDYFQAMINELKGDTIQWIRRGPYNKRNYDVADVTSLPSALKTLVELFGSEPMFTILGSLTGLTSENDDDDDDEEKEKVYEPSPKKTKSNTTVDTAASSKSSTSVPRWYFELRRWKHTYYSLSYDTDNNEENNNFNDDDDDDEEEKDGTLDIMLFLNYQSDDIDETEGGGDIVYTIKNEDETLLRVIPDNNSLNLIYREDDNVLKFNKYINHRHANNTFYEFCASYLDLDKLKID